MREDSPCKDCPERFLACSDHCPKDERGEYGYKAWKERYEAQKKQYEQNKHRWDRPWTAASESRYRRDIKFIRYDRDKGGKQ